MLSDIDAAIQIIARRIRGHFAKRFALFAYNFYTLKPATSP
jgi:hypothetical protein